MLQDFQYAEIPIQVKYKYIGEEDTYSGIAYCDEVIDTFSGAVIPREEIVIVDSNENWNPLIEDF